MASNQATILVDLGEQRRVVEERIASGEYATADEVVQAAGRALAREEDQTNVWLLELAEESLADPGPDIPVEEVFAEIYAMHRSRKSGLTS